MVSLGPLWKSEAPRDEEPGADARAVDTRAVAAKLRRLARVLQIHQLREGRVY